MTLEEFLRNEVREGKIDFRLRASVNESGDGGDAEVRIYVHPLGRDGATTPTLVVAGDTVSLAPGSSAPGWGDTPCQ
jgi:hypothetical protein